MTAKSWFRWFALGALATVFTQAGRSEAAPVAARDDTMVVVRFKPEVCDRFVSVVHLVVGTRDATKTEQARTWRFAPGERGTQMDYARLFSILPYVESVRPQPPVASEPEPSYIEGEILVKFKASTTPEQIVAFNTRNGVVVADVIAGLEVYRLKLAPGQAVPAMCQTYEASGLVEYAEPNHRVTISMPMAPPLPAGSGSIDVAFAPGATPQLINLVFGTSTLGPGLEGTTRLAPAPQASATSTARALSLCPSIARATVGR